MARNVNDLDCQITADFAAKSGGGNDFLLISAAAEGDVDKIGTALRLGGNVNFSDEELMTPLAWAARCNHLSTVSYLISHGADVNQSFSYQRDMHYKFKNSSALIWAASNNNVQIVKFLVEHGADKFRREVIYEVQPGGSEIFLKHGRSARDVTNNKLILKILSSR